MDALGFINELLSHFRVKRDNTTPEREKNWTLALVRELKPFDSDVLKKASETIIRKRRNEWFPLASECIDACLEARRWIEAEANKGKLQFSEAATGHGHLDWTAERLKLTTELSTNRNDPMCVEAAKQGWIGCLWNFARLNGRLPTRHEAETCKRQAREFDEAYRECVKGGWDQAEKFEKMGASILKKRAELAAQVLGAQK